MTDKCQFYLTNGLASSTRQVYASAQCHFLKFCSQDTPIKPSQPLLPASEQTLMHFCTHLTDSLHHSSIKVYLSAVRSLHIDYGFADPIVNRLQLQRLLRGIKRHHGSDLPQRQPVTADLMSVLHKSLDFTNPDNVMLWAACCLGFFGFLRAGEFTTNGPFDPTVHLTAADLQVDSSTNPQSFRVLIKCSKTDPFRQGSFIYLGRGSLPLCPVTALTNYLHLHGPAPDLSLFTKMALLFLDRNFPRFIKPLYRQQVFLESFQGIVLELEPQQLLLREVFLTISLRQWVAGQAMLTCYMCEHLWKPSFQ